MRDYAQHFRNKDRRADRASKIKRVLVDTFAMLLLFTLYFFLFWQFIITIGGK